MINKEVELVIDKICRCCMCKDENMHNVFENRKNTDGSSSILLSEMLKACASVEVIFEDRLPYNVCETCENKLNTAYEFRQQCQNTDSFLRELTNAVSIPNIAKQEDRIQSDVPEEMFNEVDNIPLNQRNIKRKRGETGMEGDNFTSDLMNPCEKTFSATSGLFKHLQVQEQEKNCGNIKIEEIEIKHELDASEEDNADVTNRIEIMEGVNNNKDLHTHGIIQKENRKIYKQSINSKEIQAKRSKRNKPVHCKFCNKEIPSRNFVRHIQRNHMQCKEVKDVLRFPKKSNERRHASALLRNSTNFDLYLKGNVRPVRQQFKDIESTDYYPCVYCKGLYIRKYLARHMRTCKSFEINQNRTKDIKRNCLSHSQTFTACALDPTNVISQLNVKEQVFDVMKGDDIAFEAKKDLLIAHVGNSYLKKHKGERLAIVCSARMRELSRLVIDFRKIVNDQQVSLKEILQPKHFDNVLTAVRNIAGYDTINKTFVSPSLVIHLGTSLKFACNELICLILKESNGFTYQSAEEYSINLQNVKRFKKLVESRWNIAFSSPHSDDFIDFDDSQENLGERSQDGVIEKSSTDNQFKEKDPTDNKSMILNSDEISGCLENTMAIPDNFWETICTKTKTSRTKTSWTECEINLLNKHFSKYINSETYPSGADVKAFIEETKIERSVLVIRSKIQHLINVNRRKSTNSINCFINCS